MIINTLNTKEQQLKQGWFSIGTGGGKILIIGSCRSVPYVQYFHDWNDQNNNRFTIRFIDPFNFNYDLQDNRINMEEKINSLEKEQSFLDMLKDTDIFIHEFYQNFGMFNTNKEGEKNIYQFGFSPKIDICIPSFNDKFILVADIVKFDMEIRKKVIADYNVIGRISSKTLEEINNVKNKNLEKFLEVCKMSDFPEFGTMFKKTYDYIRYFHNSNHITKKFTSKIFLSIIGILDNKEYHSGQKWDRWLIEYLNSTPDMYANIFTPLTEYDEGYSWNEPIIPLKELL